MMNMLDDHDLIDGFGSYPDDLQTSSVFNYIGSRGYFWFLLFQLFTVDEVDGLPSKVGDHTFKSTIIGGDGPFIPSAGHSMLTYLGPQVYMLLLDCRAERKKTQICSPKTYERIFRQLESLPAEVEHLVILVGIPIAYPRMNFLERALDSKINPLVILGKAGTMAPGMSGFLNKFNKDAELLDDLSDHWTAGDHKKERNWFTHKTMHDVQTDECMLPLFVNDTNGKAPKSKYIMGRRNWTQVDYDHDTKDLVYDIRVEKEKGVGTTVGFEVRSPPPRWK
ncbi:hypothetical protein FRC03_009397 [Tulasnella sp. 419]|nr:hypothetical protein FRC03_009397 [Tulasnella sp. 419]